MKTLKVTVAERSSAASRVFAKRLLKEGELSCTSTSRSVGMEAVRVPAPAAAAGERVEMLP